VVVYHYLFFHKGENAVKSTSRKPVQISFVVDFENGYSHLEFWQPEKDIYCPKCGKKNCWGLVKRSDLTFLCMACSWLFYFAERSLLDGKWQIEQRIVAIKACLNKRAKRVSKPQASKKDDVDISLNQWANEGGRVAD